MLGIDAGCDQRIMLELGNLANVCLGYPRVTDLRRHIYVHLQDQTVEPDFHATIESMVKFPLRGKLTR